MNWRDSIWVQTRSRSGRSRCVKLRSVELKEMKENSRQQKEDSRDHIILHNTPAALLQAEKNIIKLGAILERINRHILEIDFHFNNNLRKRKKYCATSSIL